MSTCEGCWHRTTHSNPTPLPSALSFGDCGHAPAGPSSRATNIGGANARAIRREYCAGPNESQVRLPLECLCDTSGSLLTLCTNREKSELPSDDVLLASHSTTLVKLVRDSHTSHTTLPTSPTPMHHHRQHFHHHDPACCAHNTTLPTACRKHAMFECAFVQFSPLSPFCAWWLLHAAEPLINKCLACRHHDKHACPLTC